MTTKRPITDIDGNIASAQNSLSLYPRSHTIHMISVYTLAMAWFNRFTLSQQKEDLDKSILYSTEAIFLPPIPWAGLSLSVVQLLFRLASALLYRAMEFKQSEGVKYSIEYFRYLRGLPLESFDVSRDLVTTSLIQAFAIQVVSEAENGTQNTEDMVVLYRELLTSNSSTDFPVAVSMSLNEAVNAEFLRGSVQSLDTVIECLRDAVNLCLPGSHLVLFSLSNTLFLRFVQTHSNDDYEEATTLLERIFDPNRPGECPDSIRDLAPSLTLCSPTSNQPSSRTHNIPKCRLLVSAPYSDLLPLMKNFVFESPTCWRSEPESVLTKTVSLRALKKQTPILHRLSTFRPLKPWNNLGNFS
ncbi:hypothetical protein EDB92DRAFT_544016 [Lactarius akahatsu]|uniref:Uncharacterized protein n=1 Tax=Lactarius akahatsu TaxID=416441 RepID=A0AAD4LMP4_9AGAM|nr:hypothetical protein EDB92DRAFT_656203 [Lactarius akahatsu]KAH8992727.1 hypothetical protein EDB92DRAFT_544016 [Lactarius akahatsu]